MPRSATPRVREVIIVGGGPAGLSAALVLARCRRSVLLFDHGRPRNAAAAHMHGYLSRDGIPPHDLLKLGRAELHSYGVEIRQKEVTRARYDAPGFTITTKDKERFRCAKLVLATGVRDELPHLEGISRFYGKSVHHCQYCDGYEWRDTRLAAFGVGKHAVGLALALKTWSTDVVIVTNGATRGLAPHERILREHAIPVRTEKISRLVGRGRRLRRIDFESGPPLDRDALFFNTGQRQRSPLAEMLGCDFMQNGGVRVDRHQCTSIPGLYLCGDASHEMQFVVCAAAQGATAAVAIDHAFQCEDGRCL